MQVGARLEASGDVTYVVSETVELSTLSVTGDNQMFKIGATGMLKLTGKMLPCFAARNDDGSFQDAAVACAAGHYWPPGASELAECGHDAVFCPPGAKYPTATGSGMCSAGRATRGDDTPSATTATRWKEVPCGVADETTVGLLQENENNVVPETLSRYLFRNDKQTPLAWQLVDAPCLPLDEDWVVAFDNEGNECIDQARLKQ